MRMMLRWTVPVDKGNEMIDDGSMGEMVDKLMRKLKPEAAYFMPEGGERAGLMVFDMKDSSEIPGIAEMLFHSAEANVEFSPVMNAEDLKKGLGAL